METGCAFMCTNNNDEGSLIRLQVNMTFVRNVGRKRNDLKREWNQGVKAERCEEFGEIKERRIK